ncbi:MAG: Metallophos protein [Bacteroidetes bacterium]|nr:Metallophos protein [Bacteroidota bacterium]
MPWTLVVVLTILLPLAAINFYVGRKILRALSALTSWNRKRLRLIVIGVHVYLNLLPLAYLLAYLAAGRAAVPAFSGDNYLIDFFLSYPFWIALVVVIQLSLLFAIFDILNLAIIRFIAPLKQWWKGHSALVVVLSACLVTIYSVAVMILDTWTVRIVEREIALPEGFSCLSGFRIAEISDLQGDGRTTEEALRRYVAKINSLNPDLVLFAGDLITAGTRYIDSTANILGQLRSRFGTIAAVGDHDIFTNKPMVLKALGRVGIRVIEDSTIFLLVDTCRIALSVVTYTYPQRPTQDQLEKISAEGQGDYRILLVHQPAESIVEFARDKGYQLLLAGHTHGGGVAFGLPGVFLMAPASLETRFVSGLYHVGQLNLSVTNGLGLTLAPVRFHAPAEIVLIILK